MVLIVYEGDSAFTGGAAKLEPVASENIDACMYILFSVLVCLSVTQFGPAE